MKTVRDIMNSEVIKVQKGTNLQALIELLDDEGISGVPVVDTDGTTLGVVSRTDLIRFLVRQPEGPSPDTYWRELGRVPLLDEDDDPDAYFLSPESTVVPLPTAEALADHPLEDTLVEDVMTPVAFSVRPDMSVPELAGFLVRGRIHRALVVLDGRLVGIVTAFDVLGAVANDASR